MAEFASSRAMPAWMVERLRDIQTSPSKLEGRVVLPLDGRSEKKMQALLDLEFVEIVSAEAKNPRERLYGLTKYGEAALERHKRGLDPYLRMTA